MGSLGSVLQERLRWIAGVAAELVLVILKNRHRRYAGFFVFSIITVTIAGCVSTVNKTKEVDRLECRESANSNLKTVTFVLNDSLSRGKWRYGYDLENKGQILLKMGSQLALVGEFSPEAKSAYLDLFLDPSVSSFCAVRSNTPRVEYLLIDIPKKVDLMPGAVNYLFVYPNASHRKYPVELVRLSKLIGKLLVIQVPDSSPENLLEARKMIVHEGAHFFGQEAITHIGPPSPNGDQSSRTYIEQLALNDPDFRRSIQNEFCLARELFSVDNEDVENDSVISTKLTLIQLLDEANKRGALFNVANQEAFWYFLEGIPQYLEQNIDIEADPLALHKQYNRLCVDPSEVDFSVYFLYLGAAILHGLDLVSEEKSSEMEFLYLEPENVLNFRQRARELLEDK